MISRLAAFFALLPVGYAGNSIYLVDEDAGTANKGLLFRLDDTGRRTVVADFGAKGNKIIPGPGQPAGKQPTFVAVEADGTVLVLDLAAGTGGRAAVFRVDPDTGDRSILSDFGNAKQGFRPKVPDAFAVTPDGSIWVGDTDGGSECFGGHGITCAAIVRVDPVTGNRTYASDFGNPDQGELGVVIQALAPEPSGTLLVSTYRFSSTYSPNFFNGIVRFDPATGKRIKDVTDFQNPAQGGAFAGLAGAMAEESGGTILAYAFTADHQNSRLYRIDPGTGSRALLSDFSNPAQGIVFQQGGTLPGMTLATVGGIGVALANGLTQRIGPLGKAVIPCVVRIDLTNGSRTLFSNLNSVAQGVVGTDNLGGMAFFGAPPPPPPPPINPGDLLTVAGLGAGPGLIKIDPTTGIRTLLSDFTSSAQGPTGAAWAPAANASGSIFVTDFSDDLLFSVAANTGTRGILSDFTDSMKGDTGFSPYGVGIDSTGDVLVTDRGSGGGGNGAALFRVNPASGVRAKLSDFNSSAQGPTGLSPEAVALDAGGSIMVIDAEAGTDCHSPQIMSFCGALFRIDRTNGTRTMVSDFGDSAKGPFGEDPGGLARDVDGSFLVIDPFAGTNGKLFRVNASTGVRTVVSDFGNTAQGPAFGGHQIGVAVSNGVIFITCSPGASVGVCKVDPTTGVRTMFSDFTNAAQGPGVSARAPLAVYP